MDTFKCGEIERVWAQHKDKLAVSNCCAVMNAEPPCTERGLHRWIPLVLAMGISADRFQQRWFVPHYIMLIIVDSLSETLHPPNHPITEIIVHVHLTKLLFTPCINIFSLV